MKRIIGVIIAIMLMTVIKESVSASGISEEAIAEETIDGYLLNAGYSAEFINDIDSNIKSYLYKEGYSFESSEQNYGILTEEYCIKYTIRVDGSIDIDTANLSEFRELLNDSAAIEKILSSNAKQHENYSSSVNNAEEVKSISENEVLRSLSNWEANITCSHKSYSDNVAKKYLTYSWKWSYAPVWTLTDKVAMAWSGDFTAVPETIYWTYKKNVGFTGSQVYMDYINENGFGYDDYDCNAGCAKGIDIRGSIPGTYNRYHKGTLSAEIRKTTAVNSSESAIGRYYHKKVTPGLALSFSKSGPSISVSAGNNYDQSSDSATAFWAIS